MIDLTSGSIKINNSFKLYPGYTFENFKNSDYYNGQDGIRIIHLNDRQIIDGHEYAVSFFFREKKLYMISLINCEVEFSEEIEMKRKNRHDGILEENNIENGKVYPWGKVVSDYDPRGNISSINLYYH